MISQKDQEKLFLDIAQTITKSVTTYAIGGTAMMFHGIKDATKDIDLVFTDEKDRTVFIKAIEKLGYEKHASRIVYFEKKNVPLMFSRGDERFDLFLTKIISFTFSSEMIEQASKHQFGKLLIYIATPEDIILMKCATDREKDLDDARNIINSQDINWDRLVERAKTQIKLGDQTTLLDLGFFLERLSKLITIPKKVLNTLFDLVKKQIEKRG